MSTNHLPEPSSWAGALLLPQWGVIAAEGDDAASFLHGQLSQDVTGQAPDQGRLAAYCSVKGRMLASLTLIRPDDTGRWLVTDAQVLPSLLKRLSMFVMRAKAKLRDASAELAVVGLVGDSARGVLTAGQVAWSVSPLDGGTLLRLPDVLGVPRAWWVGPQASAHALLARSPALDADAWQWLEVMSGIAHVTLATADQFVPQMVNYELVGGINFKKGCYPGQEVVARSQYRGTTKRRAVIVHAEQALQAGQEVFSALDPAQPAGMVINVARWPTSAAVSQTGHSALIELKLQAQGSALTLGSPTGAALTLGTLPYPLASDESED